MKHFIQLSTIILLFLSTAMVWTSCSDDADDYEWVENALVGTWRTEATTSADPYAVVQHVFTFTRDASGIPGALSHYTMADVLANGNIVVTEQGTAGHPNGQSANVWALHNTKNGGEKEVTIIFLNKERTQMRFESKFYIVKDVFHKQ